ncbi:hypothetical protein [Krasilnikovia sp. MM14-A1004]|uniref:hypothetical protein n=1 Tax=Krasilnikovia sp. MM14-A1004 TaxID=3373541 RepID=UPI00399CC408
MGEGRGRALPAAVLASGTAVVLALAGAWWARTAPREPASTPPGGGGLVTLQLDDGAVVSYDGGRTAITDPAKQLVLLQRLVDAQWPCRVPRRAPFPRTGGMGGPDRRVLVPDGAPGVVRLPRCAGLGGAATFGPAR